MADHCVGNIEVGHHSHLGGRNGDGAYIMFCQLIAETGSGKAILYFENDDIGLHRRDPSDEFLGCQRLRNLPRALVVLPKAVNIVFKGINAGSSHVTSLSHAPTENLADS